MLSAIVLGIVQGLTEFLPISSTAHLVLLPWVFDWGGTLNSLTFDVALHAGTLVSLLICLKKDILEIVSKRRNLLVLLAVGTVPAGLAGVFLGGYVSGSLRSPAVIAAMLVVFGLVMYVAEKFRKGKAMDRITLRDALFIGLAQAVALVPGVSRSGITISAGLVRGVAREEAARFSFLLSIPVIAGALLLEGGRLVSAPGDFDFALMGAGFASALVTGLLAIKFMLAYLRGHTMNAFVAYRILLAGVIAGWLWLGG
jgi:undecaprenyl-diphosphatase